MKTNSRLQETQIGILFVLPALALLLAVILYPLLNSMYIGFIDKSLLYGGDKFVGFENLQSVFKYDFFLILKNTIVFTFFATVIPYLIGFGIAVVLNSGVFGQSFLRGAFLLPWLIPSVIVSFLWLWIFNANYGVLNGFLRNFGVIDHNMSWLSTSWSAMTAVVIAKTWQSFPWITVMMLAGLQAISIEELEAAAIDGANKWQTFFKVTLPHMRSVSQIVLLLSLIWNFQHFETIFVMTRGGPAKATTTFAIAVYQMAFQEYNLGKAGALGILWMVILSVVVLVYLQQGLISDEEVSA